MTKLFLVARPIFFLDYARTPTAKKANTVSKIKAPIALSPERRGKKERRHTADRRIENHTVAVERRKLQRREKVTRRRQIDPTTCERDYSDDEVEFMHALDQYKRTSGRMFPTCSEVLEVIRNLGYVKTNSAAATQIEVSAENFESPDMNG